MKLALMHTLDAVHLLTRQTAMPNEHRRAILDAIGRARLEVNKAPAPEPAPELTESILGLPLPFEIEMRAEAANRGEVE